LKSIGPHRVTSLSVEDPGVAALFDDGRKATILYSDPPWGDANVKYWATMAKKMTGQAVEPLRYDVLLDSIFDLIARFVTDHVFLETGLRFEEENLSRMQRIGLKNLSRVELVYDHGKQKNLLLFGSFTGGRADLAAMENWTGMAIPVEAVRQMAVPGGIVFDPCCGMGYSAHAALRNGMEFRGNELNEKRLAKTVERLERYGDHRSAQ
jgi:hypothetical protein